MYFHVPFTANATAIGVTLGASNATDVYTTTYVKNGIISFGSAHGTASAYDDRPDSAPAAAVYTDVDVTGVGDLSVSTAFNINSYGPNSAHAAAGQTISLFNFGSYSILDVPPIT